MSLLINWQAMSILTNTGLIISESWNFLDQDGLTFQEDFAGSMKTFADLLVPLPNKSRHLTFGGVMMKLPMLIQPLPTQHPQDPYFISVN